MQALQVKRVNPNLARDWPTYETSQVKWVIQVPG